MRLTRETYELLIGPPKREEIAKEAYKAITSKRLSHIQDTTI